MSTPASILSVFMSMMTPSSSVRVTLCISDMKTVSCSFVSLSEARTLSADHVIIETLTELFKSLTLATTVTVSVCATAMSASASIFQQEREKESCAYDDDKEVCSTADMLSSVSLKVPDCSLDTLQSERRPSLSVDKLVDVTSSLSLKDSTASKYMLTVAALASCIDAICCSSASMDKSRVFPEKLVTASSNEASN